MSFWDIYTLSDPRTPEEVRYVGKTSCGLERRLSGHLSYARRSKSKTHLVNWLKALVAESVRPQVRGVERGTGAWEAAERRWITWYREHGYDLCNATDGGEGASLGHVKSPETRAKLSAANKGRVHSAKARARMSAARRGRGPVLTAESYAKMSRTKTGRPGPKLSPESIAKRVATNKATWKRKKAEGWKPTPCSPEGRARTIAANKGRKCSLETRAKIAAANKGRGSGRKLSPETRARMSAAQKAGQAKARRNKGPS